MKLNDAVSLFSALAQEVRLTVLRRVIEAGHEGVSPKDLLPDLSVAPSVLSFHLKELEHVGLIEKRKEGRRIYYCPVCSTLKALGDFIFESCACYGVTEKNKE